MTKTEAKALGYRIVQASTFEVGLIKGKKGIRTWFNQDFDRQMPELDHPKVLQAIAVNEDFEQLRHLVPKKFH